MTRRGGFRMFEAGDVFIFERIPPGDTDMTPLMSEGKALQFTDRKAALTWLRRNGHKIMGFEGKKFAIVKFLDSLQISVEARAAVTILAQPRAGAVAPAETPITVKEETKP